MYGIDLESESGIPSEATSLNEILDSADGIVISLAEHNGSYAAAFKNAYDWLSRIDSKVWKNKPMLLMATSPGDRGGASVLQTAKTGFPYLGGKIMADFVLPSFYENFSKEGLKNEDLNTELNQKIKLFQEALLKEYLSVYINANTKAKTEIISPPIKIEYAYCKNLYFLARTIPRKYKSFDKDP